MPAALGKNRTLEVIGLATWAIAGLPIFLGAGLPAALPAWIVFGAAFFLATWPGDRTRSLRVPLLALQTVAALTIGISGGRGFEGIFFVLVAAQLSFCLAARPSAIWVVVQSVLYFGVKLLSDGPLGALVLALAYGTFQVFAMVVTMMARREAVQREDLARLNADLHAAQALLAESSRAAERARIARDLHDVMGHHLTALSLRLEVASHVAEGRAKTEVEKAREIARLLLADVRGVVGAFREDEALDLAPALALLAAPIETPKVTIDVAADLGVADPNLAETILRAVQEIVTNAARHAQAKTLVVAVRRGGAGIEIDARDDGRGVATIREGDGLRGMRERLAAWGGRLEVTTAPGAGFHLALRIPFPAEAG